MELTRTISGPLQRMTVIDALRGFALLGVILMHMLDHFGYTSSVNLTDAKFPKLDMYIQMFAEKVIAGRFISIFSFLFGLSFFIQMDRASKKGIDFRGRFLWRMVLLFVIGMIGACFTYLDILSIYAVFGVVLVFLFPFKNWVLICFATLLLSGAPLVAIIGPNNITMSQTMVNSQPAPTGFTNNDDIEYAPSIENGANQHTTFFQSANENLTTKMIGKLRFQFALSSRGYLIFALFILGFLVGRVRFFEKVHIKRKKNIYLFVGFLLAAIVFKLTGRIFVPKEPVNLLLSIAEKSEVPFTFIVSSTLNELSMLMQSGVLAMGIIVLHQTRIGKYIDVLSFYGRMGLTNYEMQGIIGAILFSMWGFGAIVGQWGITELFALGLIIYVSQIIISKYWMKYFLYGPLEWLWRSGTYMKWQPFKRKNIVRLTPAEQKIGQID